MGLDGLEPSASPLSGVRSNHLSYRPSAAECARHSPSSGTVAVALSQIRPAPALSRQLGLPGITRVLCGRSNQTSLLTLKEVIQPHLPIRLPCYDFTPVIDHTVASALRLATVKLPASGAANSHGVTGGVYKARERIHRGSADPRLLGVCRTWGRGSDRLPEMCSSLERGERR